MSYEVKIKSHVNPTFFHPYAEIEDMNTHFTFANEFKEASDKYFHNLRFPEVHDLEDLKAIYNESSKAYLSVNEEGKKLIANAHENGEQLYSEVFWNYEAVQLNRISVYSNLYSMLLDWYGAKELNLSNAESNLMVSANFPILKSFEGAHKAFYYLTNLDDGDGNSRFETDLLGGTGDGRYLAAFKQFFGFDNTDEDHQLSDEEVKKIRLDVLQRTQVRLVI